MNQIIWKTLVDINDDCTVVALSLGGYDGPTANLGLRVVWCDDIVLYDVDLADVPGGAKAGLPYDGEGGAVLSRTLG